MNATKKGEATVAADGGLKDGLGTFGATFDWNSNDRINVRGPVSVSRFSDNSLRPEMMGLWVALKLLDMLFAYKPKLWNKKLKIVMHADNDEAIKRAQDKFLRTQGGP